MTHLKKKWRRITNRWTLLLCFGLPWAYLFAQIELPKAFSKTTYPVTIHLFLSQSHVHPQQTFYLALEFHIDTPYHIYAPKMFQRDTDIGIPTEVTLRLPEKVALLRQWVVKPVMKDIPALGGALALYEQTVHFFYELKAQGIRPGDYPIQAVLKYAACTNRTCLNPKLHDAHIITLSVVKNESPYQYLHPDIFHQLDQQGSNYVLLKNTSDQSPVPFSYSTPSLSNDEPSSNTPEGQTTPLLTQFPATESPAGILGQLKRGIDWALKKNRLLALALIFIAGFLSSFTPCTYPMIPIVLSYFSLQHKQKQSAVLISAICFVFGLAVVYSSLGLTVALSGKMLGQQLGQAWIVYALSLIFILMALSLLGGFELKVPSLLYPTMGKEKGVYVSSFLMGSISGVVAAPCIGPILLVLLTFVSVTHSVVFGFTALFMFSLGIGIIFIILALFSHALTYLPRSGVWLNTIKYLFGLLILGVAVYLLYPRLNTRLALVFCTVIMGVLSLTYLYAIVRFRSMPQLIQYLFRKKVYAGLVVMLSLLFSGAYLEKVRTEKPPGYWLQYERQAIEQAEQAKKPLIMDFSADWCIACQELGQIYKKPIVQTELKKHFSFVQIDVTDKDREDVQALVYKYERLTHENGLLPPELGLALPFVAIYNAHGQFLPRHSFFGGVRSPQELLNAFRSIPLN